MRIVIDTNVVISGIFFGGVPRKILSAAVGGRLTACATMEILDEYEEIIQEMVEREQGHLNHAILQSFFPAMEIVAPVSQVTLSRDPDDDKFLGCAKDARALYIVSGDKDLLILEQFEGIQIITAKEFCDRYLL